MLEPQHNNTNNKQNNELKKEVLIMKKKTPKWLLELATKLGKEDAESIMKKVNKNGKRNKRNNMP